MVSAEKGTYWVPEKEDRYGSFLTKKI